MQIIWVLPLACSHVPSAIEMERMTHLEILDSSNILKDYKLCDTLFNVYVRYKLILIRTSQYV